MLAASTKLAGCCHYDWSESRAWVSRITSSGFDFLSAIENTSVGFGASSASAANRVLPCACMYAWACVRACVQPLTLADGCWLGKLPRVLYAPQIGGSDPSLFVARCLFEVFHSSPVPRLSLSPLLLLCCNYIATSTYGRVRYTEPKGAGLNAKEYKPAAISGVTFATTVLLNHNILTFSKTQLMRLWTDEKENLKKQPLSIDWSQHLYECMPSVRHSVTASLRLDDSCFSCLSLLLV